MSLTPAQLSKGMKVFERKMRRTYKKLQAEGLPQQVRVIVVKDDGSEHDLCDISKPLTEIMEGVDKQT